MPTDGDPSETAGYESYITRPAAAAASSTKTPQHASARTRRLYIGNLHPAVDEYVLANIFSRYGKITKMDYLFHKAGPMKGKPRGFAFVEYGSQEEAAEALAQTNGNTLRGRKLTVSFANAAPEPSGGAGPHRHQGDASKPTTLSLLKSAAQPKGVDAKIAAMEAKLAKLRGESPSEGSSSPRLKGHPSLPARPTSRPASNDGP